MLLAAALRTLRSRGISTKFCSRAFLAAFHGSMHLQFPFVGPLMQDPCISLLRRAYGFRHLRGFAREVKRRLAARIAVGKSGHAEPLKAPVKQWCTNSWLQPEAQFKLGTLSTWTLWIFTWIFVKKEVTCILDISKQIKWHPKDSMHLHSIHDLKMTTAMEVSYHYVSKLFDT